jgi:RHS repeat-associated protein
MIDPSGSVVGQYTFGPYGDLKGGSGASTPFGYAGQYADPESGLQYLRSRYYDPSVEQFLSVDPLASVTGEPYSYTGDAPLDGVDPLGLCKAGPVNVPFGGSGHCSDDLGAAVYNAEKSAFVLRPDQLPAVSRPGTINYALASGLPITIQGGGAADEEGSCTLYRAVGDAELADIQATGAYRPHPGGVEGKYFYLTARQASNFARMSHDNYGSGPSTLTSARYPRGKLPEPVYPAGEGEVYFLEGDAFPLGPVTVYDEMPLP